MAVFKGSTTGSILSSGKNVASTIESYSMVNTSGSVVNYNIWIVEEGVLVAIRYRSLSPFTSYEEPYCRIQLKRDFEILITSNGPVDFYFSIN